MVRGQGPAIVSEYALAAVVHCLPCPRAISEGQRLRNHVAAVVKEVSADLAGCWSVADALEPARVLLSNTAIRWVHDELPARSPLIDVAREDPHRRRP